MHIYHLNDYPRGKVKDGRKGKGRGRRKEGRGRKRGKVDLKREKGRNGEDFKREGGMSKEWGRGRSEKKGDGRDRECDKGAKVGV